MSVGQSKAIRARQGKMNRQMQRTEKLVDEMHNIFDTDFSLLIDRKPIEEIPTRLFVDEVNVDTGEITEVVYTTQLAVDLEPLSPEEEEHAQKLAAYWAKKFEEDLIRQLMGGPSEYEHSLRAAGSKV
jgi:hypothetical protein